MVCCSGSVANNRIFARGAHFVPIGRRSPKSNNDTEGDSHTNQTQDETLSRAEGVVVARGTLTIKERTYI
jgi:hypothetical protein